MHLHQHLWTKLVLQGPAPFFRLRPLLTHVLPPPALPLLTNVLPPAALPLLTHVLPPPALPLLTNVLPPAALPLLCCSSC
jgi:hypothetical protein